MSNGITIYVPPKAKRVLFAFGAVDDVDLWSRCNDEQRRAMWNADMVLLSRPFVADESFFVFGVAKLIGFGKVNDPGAITHLHRAFPMAGTMPGDGPWGQGAVRIEFRDATLIRLAAAPD